MPVSPLNNVKTPPQKLLLIRLTLIALFTAANIVLSRFLSFNMWNLKIGFTFVSIAFAAYFTGPVGAAAVGALGDLIGALLFPIGPYFPGFTLTALLCGLCFGFFINKNVNIPKIIIAVLLNELIGSALLNTMWISILYRGTIKQFGAVFMGRIFVQIIPMCIVEIIFLYLVFSKGMLMQRIEKAIK